MKPNKKSILIVAILLTITTLLYLLNVSKNTAIKTTGIATDESFSKNIENPDRAQSNTEGNTGLDSDENGGNSKNSQINTLNNNLPNKPKSGKPLPMVLPDDVMKAIDKEMYSQEYRNKTLVEMGFNKEAVTKLDPNSPNENLLSIQAAPKGLRDLVNKQLEDNKKRGYDLMNDAAMTRIINAVDYILGTYPIKSITFSPSNIPHYVTDNYDYLGYTFPGASYGDGLNVKHGTLWRLYQAKDTSHTILLEESGHGKYAGSYTFKETINDQVLGHPAKYKLFKSPNGRSFTLLTWKIKFYGYALHFIGLPNNNNKKILTKFAGELTKANEDKDSELTL